MTWQYEQRNWQAVVGVTASLPGSGQGSKPSRSRAMAAGVVEASMGAISPAPRASMYRFWTPGQRDGSEHRSQAGTCSKLEKNSP